MVLRILLVTAILIIAIVGIMVVVNKTPSEEAVNYMQIKSSANETIFFQSGAKREGSVSNSAEFCWKNNPASSKKCCENVGIGKKI